MLKRQQRIEESLFEKVPEDIYNDSSAITEATSAEPSSSFVQNSGNEAATTITKIIKKIVLKKKKKKFRKKGYVYSDEDASEDGEGEEDVYEEQYVVVEVPVDASGAPRRRVGRPRKYPRPEDLEALQAADAAGNGQEEEEPWFFDCICGISGQNYGGEFGYCYFSLLFCFRSFLIEYSFFYFLQSSM